MFIKILKAIFLGLVEGVTEWLPISSTGHMLLVDEFLNLGMGDAFKEMFIVVVQFGAILAVIIMFWKKIMPIKVNEGGVFLSKKISFMWVKIFVASIPAGIIGFLFDDKIDTLFYNPTTVGIMLIVYGILFIAIEINNKGKKPKIKITDDMDYKTAFLMGVFQALSLIPGTSRSGATIVGGLIFGVSRTAAAEFSFFMAIPAMLVASLFKLIKFGFNFTGVEVAVLLSGMIVAFIVSVFIIRFLMNYIKRHDFRVFGWYRIFLGAIVLVYFLLIV
ncbi:MAG: undecaprenyl-diphosphate phosphatase [Lachnospiraceae bacterium]|nr:undecaprenyl-diphosphate phosphatase [Lachnospiraceae bacterium]